MMYYRNVNNIRSVVLKFADLWRILELSLLWQWQWFILENMIPNGICERLYKTIFAILLYRQYISDIIYIMDNIAHTHIYIYTHTYIHTHICYICGLEYRSERPTEPAGSRRTLRLADAPATQRQWFLMILGNNT